MSSSPGRDVAGQSSALRPYPRVGSTFGPCIRLAEVRLRVRASLLMAKSHVAKRSGDERAQQETGEVGVTEK